MIMHAHSCAHTHAHTHHIHRDARTYARTQNEKIRLLTAWEKTDKILFEQDSARFVSYQEYWPDVISALRGGKQSLKRRTAFNAEFQPSSGMLKISWLLVVETFSVEPVFEVSLSPVRPPQEVADEHMRVLLKHRNGLASRMEQLKQLQSNLQQVRREAESDKMLM